MPIYEYKVIDQGCRYCQDRFEVKQGINDEPLKKDTLCLLDFGIRDQSITTDISRTLPLSGKFNPLQKLLYNIVISAQKIVEKHVKPGVCINQINQIVWHFIRQELKTQIADKGGAVKLPYTNHPHNVSHLIGHLVHEGDPFRIYRDQPLKAGQVISNEPGVYGYFELKIKGKKYREDLGIRVEDMLLVTKNGCKNLTKACPK